jgi:release factor glutamine methyltransferase
VASHPDIVARLRAAGCVFAEDEAALLFEAGATPAEVTALVSRRSEGVPIEQVLGWAEFCGLRIAVEPGVFVPRHRTELLAREATSLGRPRAVVLDLCCGSGALGAAVRAATGPIDLHASDVEPAAVRCARRNLGTDGAVYQGDLYDPLPAKLRGRIEVLMANVPYVPTAEIGLMPREARDHEPRVALDGGTDGLDVLRRVAADAPSWLAPGGSLLFETSEGQERDAVQAVTRSGLTPRVVRSEEEDATVVIATRPGR